MVLQLVETTTCFGSAQIPIAIIKRLSVTSFLVAADAKLHIIADKAARKLTGRRINRTVKRRRTSSFSY